MDRLLSGRRILVVEDEPMILWTVEEMLGDLGCESIATAATVEQGLALVAAQPFDAAMLDLNLDGAQSDPVAAALTDRGVPFIVSTGYGDHVGAFGRPDRRLRKPYRFEDLAKAFARLFGVG